jgi:tetratricopeptide (TPR) repeat protein
MKKSLISIVLFLLGTLVNVAVGQTMPTTDMDKHIKKEVQYAILLMDNGMVKESIHFLDSMNVVHPDNFLVMFELGYAHLLDKNYEKSLNIYKYMCDNLSDSDAQTYQMLGNLYDYNGNREKAIETYKKGIEKGYMLEILSRVTLGEDAIYQILLEAFQNADEKELPLCAGYLAAYGDERALPHLYRKIEDKSIGFVEFQELKYAIEALGGEYDEERDFTADKDYMRVQSAKEKGTDNNETNI